MIRALTHLADWLQLLRARAIVHRMNPAAMTDEELSDWLRGRPVAMRTPIATHIATDNGRGFARIPKRYRYRGRVS